MQKVADRNCAYDSQRAEREVKHAAHRYLIHYRHFTPIVWTRVVDHGVSLTIRHLCEPRARSGISMRIWEDILNEFAACDDIDFAYPTQRFYFNKTEDADLEQCPYLADEDNVRRIRMAKEIMISRMAEPPTLAELSQEVGLSLKKLKEGFKQIYGDSVFGFLFDYKMDYARKMLETGKHNVNEVGLKVGYSTASHFIASFKKKFGTTPKKYLTSNV
mgnify:CR=1 FL=1